MGMRMKKRLTDQRQREIRTSKNPDLLASEICRFSARNNLEICKSKI